MFNRNLQSQQFLDVDALEPSPGSSGPSGRRGKGPSFPLAGGTFEAAETPKLATDAWTPGTWISQSSQTMLPGEANVRFSDRADKDPVVTFAAHDEGEEGRWQAPLTIGNSKEGEAAVTLESHLGGGEGSKIRTTRLTPNEEVGQAVRGYQAVRNEERQDNERDRGAL